MFPSIKAGRWELVYNNGAASVLYHGSDHEYILNIKPTPNQAQEFLVQLFVLKSPEVLNRAEQASV